MKLIYLFLLLLLFQDALSQTTITIGGKVTDNATKEPLAYVTIHLAGTSLGTVTNQSGNFILKYPATGQGKTAVFSHLGYKPFQMSLKNAPETNLVISLVPQPLEMKEIVVKPLNALDIVYKCIDKIPQNYNYNFHTVQGFQREYVKQSDQYIQLLEAAFETKSLGSERAPISNVLDARYIEDKKEKAPLYSASRGGFYTFGWKALSGIENPDKSNFLGVNLKKKSDLAKYYTFELKEPIRVDNQELHVIAFDQKKNVRQPLLKGLLYIEPESNALVKLTYELSPRGVKYLKSQETWGNKKVSSPPKKINVKKDRGEITYRK